MTSSENMVDFVKNSREELSIEWRIHDFFSLSFEDETLESPYFQFCGAVWSLELCTTHDEGEEDPYSGWVAFDFNRIDSGPPVTIHFRVGIKGPEGVEKEREEEHEFLSEQGYQYTDFLSRSELKNQASRLMPNNILTITCELNKNASSSARGVEKLQRSLRSILKSGEDCDIIFKVQGREFRAHRILLKARSPVFRAMLTHDMVERQSGVVAIDDCDPQAFSDFLDHVYTGSNEKINTENVLNLYMISDKYEMDTLKEQCVECIKKNLSIASFCSVMTLALKYDDEAVTKLATQFFCDNSSHIVTTTEWKAFYEENPAVGYDLFIKALTK